MRSLKVFLLLLTLSACGEKASLQTRDVCPYSVSRAVTEVNNRCWYLRSPSFSTVTTQVRYLREACIELKKSGLTSCQMASNTGQTSTIQIHDADRVCETARLAERDSHDAMSSAQNGEFISPWENLTPNPTHASTY